MIILTYEFKDFVNVKPCDFFWVLYDVAVVTLKQGNIKKIYHFVKTIAIYTQK